MKFSDLSLSWKKRMYEQCADHSLCTERFFNGIKHSLTEEIFYYLCKDIHLETPESFSIYELISKRPHEEQSFCAGFNEFPSFNHKTKSWFCACKDPRSQSGCITSSSTNDTDQSVSINIAILSVILATLLLILCWNLGRYLSNMCTVKKDYMKSDDPIKNKIILSLKNDL